ncbi:MAG: TonB-dependent receptor [Burkholderiales bacterium]|nr:TonB-dependent receptor [Burkholderiales bacterium]
MFQKTKVGVAAAMLVGGAGLLAGTAQAQSTDQRVEITGSRILSIGAQSPAPVQVLTSEDIAKSGVTNVQELLLKLPSLGTPAISRTNSNFQTSSSGVATVDLRDLGTDRTLVLVNGRRFVSGLPGSAAVDLTTIPTDFIERIEILTGGASATYGSDAMAGVVNIILKKAFSGVIIDVRYGESSKGDDKKGVLSLTGGLTSADGRSNIMAHFGYSKQGSVPGWTREPTDNVDNANFTGDPADFFTFTTPFFSSFAPQGRIFFDTNGAAAGGGANRTFDRAGNIIPFSTNGPAGDGVGATGFNRQAFRYLAVPTERYLFATKGELAIAESHSVFFEGTYAATQVRSQLEPFPLDSAAETGGLYPATGVGPAEFSYAGAIRANPLIPAGLLALMTDTNGDGLRDYSFTRRLSEVGNRGSTADRDTFRVLGGFKGTILKSWDYEAFAGYGATKESQVSSGQVNVLNFRNAMEAVPDVTDVDGDGNVTEAICRDEQARAQGCVPANIFGFNSLSSAAVNYITAPSLLVTLTSQKLAGGVVRGEPFVLPAGPVSLAAGFEWREEYSRSEFDPLQQAGLNAGNAIPRTEGEFHVKELFAEVRVPLLKNLPAVRALTFNGAVRGADYSTVGSVSSWTAGLEWSPMADLRFRGTQARSTRAPNINELYSPPSQTFPTGIVDPCTGVTAAQTGTLADRCRAAPGVAANIAANGGTFTLNQADTQGISGFDRGNPNLSEEVGKSWTLGIVYTPSFLRNLSVELDFFKIDIDDAIVSTPRQFILSQCYTGDASFCQFITRRSAAVGANSAGSLSFVDSAVTNSGGLSTEGYDLTLNYADRIGPGRLNSRFAYTRLSKGSVVPAAGSAPDVYAGEIGSAKDKFALSLGYSMGPFSVATTTTYIGKSALDDQLLVEGFGLPAGSITVPSKTYLDLQLNYTLGKSTFYFGMDNALGTKPPRFDTNGTLVGTTGAGTAADVYDAIGRRYYVGVRMAL